MSADAERARIRREQIAAYNRKRELDAARRSDKLRLVALSLSPLVIVPIYTLVAGPRADVIIGVPLLALVVFGPL